jgi:ABC-type branched-subunit amino acid transport system ATPase component
LGALTKFEVNEICAGYGRMPILNGISFTVEPGEVLGILGHNGMGKTTMMKTLAGHLPVRSGFIRLNDINITGLPAFKRARLGIGYVPQGRDIFPRLTVRDNLRLAMQASNSQVRIDDILTRFTRLQPLLDRQGGALSGGEQQILAVARCLSAAPSVILLDEPTEGVQPSIIDQMADNFLALRGERRYSVVLVEQNLDFIAAIADRILIMQRGAIVRSLTPQELTSQSIVDEFIGL